MPDSTPLIKDIGEPKELHEARLGAAVATLDEAYVGEFGRSVVPAYRRGVADMELPADGGLAPEIEATQAYRLADWQTLQELAGLR